MKRIILICEGPTEQAFTKTNLQVPFISKNIYLQSPLIKASRGGIVKWSKLKEQIETHLKAEPNAYVTTFIDYYGMYDKYLFPQWEEAHTIVDLNQRMEALEQGMLDDIDESLRHRFIPYLQLHEFEGLLFNDINIIKSQIPKDDIVGMPELEKTFADYDNPEMINNNRTTSPSHRLMRIIRGYNKVVYGDILSEAIGLTRIRQKSPRFNNWLTKLECI
ncbi:MAG: DUF4276 family protein [Cytophagaceae bacterium]|nr:DUF4276 family protein [Cytophagaceae bacterium]MBL0303405.1 DUF4276 family protein [Cytophagaceae bacterium]MBL0326250.1 DUF4276 family protein [Cytophagaceae bacterium]